MKFSRRRYKYVSTLTHSGSIFAFSAQQEEDNPQNYRIGYSLLNINATQSEFDSWQDFKVLDFPKELRPVGYNLITVDFKKDTIPTADVSFNVYSDGTHIYIFRQSSTNTLLVDRFIFDQSLGVLNNAWEVRYRRSQKIDTPADQNDIFGSMNMNGDRFIEPTTELTMIGNLTQGRFAAWVLPTELAGVERWLLLASNSSTGKLDIYSIARSQNGLFDLTDAIDPITHKVLPESQLVLQASEGPLSWESGPAVFLYSRQERLKNQYGQMSLLKKEIRLMVAAAVGSSKQIAILDFGVGKNGRIAQTGNSLPIAANPVVSTSLNFDRSQKTAALLPQLSGTQVETLTVECWVCASAFSGGEDLVIAANQDEPFNQVKPFSIVLNGNIPQFTVSSAGNSSSVQGEPLESKFWYHLAGTWDGSKATLYVNGQPYSVTAQPPQSLPTVSSGYLLGGTTGFSGNLKELRLWKICLDRQKILAGMNQPISSTNPDWESLIGYWTLNEPASTADLEVIPNSSTLGAAADGTRSGTPWAPTNAPVGASMAPVAWDRNGLSVATTLLTYASTDQTPALLSGADGLVHLYYRDLSSGVFFAAQYNTTTARAHYRTRWVADDPLTSSNSQSGTLRFMARQAGSLMNNANVAPEYVAIEIDSQDSLLCTVTLLHYTGLKEVWPKVPRSLTAFLEIINGEAIQFTTDPAAAAEGYVMYDYHLVQVTPGTGYPGIVPGPGTGSGVFSVMADTQPSNGIPAFVKATSGAGDQPVLVRPGADCWWITSPAIATLQLAGDGDSITIFDDQQIKNYKGDLNLSGNITLEGWVNPSAIPASDPDARILVFNNPDGGASYTLGLDDFGRPFAGTHEFSAVAQAYQIGLNRWTHLAAAYKTDYGIQLSGSQYLDGGDDTSLSSGDAVTIEAWVKLDQDGQRQVIASKWDEAVGQSWQLYVGADNVPAFDVMQVIGTDTRIATAKAPQPIAKNEWHHIAGVYDVAYKQQTAIQFQLFDQSYVTIPQLGNPPEIAVTVEVWVYLLNPFPFPVKGTQIVVYTADPEQNVLFFLELVDRIPVFTVETGTGKSIQGPSELPFETWIHLAGTWDDQGNIGLYINGLSVSGSVSEELPKRMKPDALAVPAAGASKAIYSVGGFGTNLPFNGWMNELRFWNRVLPVNDIRHNMKLQLSGGERGLVGYWPFQDRFGTTAMDLAGTSNGTLINATYIQVQKGAFTHKVLLDTDVRPGTRVEEPVNMSDSRVLMGATKSRDFLQATIDEVRLWKVGRMDWEILYYMKQEVPNSSEGLLAKWSFETGHGYVAFDSKGDNNAVIRDAKIELTDEVVDRMWLPTTFLAGWTFYVDGDAVPTESYVLPAGYGNPQFQLGAMSVSKAVGKFYQGLFNEIRIWNQVRTSVQIIQNMYRPLTGAENGLIGYWPVSAGSGEIIGDATGAGANGAWAGIENANWSISTAPVATEAPVARLSPNGVKKSTQQAVLYSPTAGEYGVVLVESSGALSGAMNRAYFFVDPQQALNLIPGYNVGELDVQFVGQVQTQPTLIGYIEGPPPVPAENLMLNSGFQNYYVGTSSLTLTLADQVAQVYTASRDTGFNLRIDAKLGAQFESRTEAGVVVSTLLFGFISKIGVHTTFEQSLGWLNDATLTTSLNINKINSVRVVGAWQKNTYAVNNKDGEMYFPNNQGYALVNSGTADLYALRLKDTGALVSYTMLPNPDIPIDVNIIPFVIDPLYVKNGTLDGYIGFEHEDSYKGLPPGKRGSYFKPLEAYALKQQIEREYQQMQAVFDEFQAAEIGRRTNATQFTSGDIGSGETDLGSLLAGVKGSQRLTNEEWKAEIARRNLVNTYVWTAEGGFYAEEEQFSAVREDSMGGSYDFTGLAGLYTEMGMSTGIHFEMDALFGGHIRTRAVKTQREGVNFGLNVDVNGERFINKLELGQQRIPIPGKVKGYRFMSFYMSPSKRNFEQFKGVVDQEWLNGQGSYAGQNDPNAFALRQALTRPNEVWRVLHRVTYVSRVPDTAEHDEGESIGLDVLRPSAEMNATNALLLSQLPATTDTMGPVSVALTIVLSTLEQNPLWGDRLRAEEPGVRTDIMQYMRGYYGI